MPTKILKFNLEHIYEAPMEKAYQVWTDLEGYATYYPDVFKAVRIAERDGNTVITEEEQESTPGVHFTARGRHIIDPPKRYVREQLSGDLAGTSREQIFESLPGGRSKVTMYMRMVVSERLQEAFGDTVADRSKGLNIRMMRCLARFIEDRSEPSHDVVETSLVAFHTGGFGNAPLDSVLPTLQRIGFDAVELNAETLPWCGPHVWPDMPAAEQERIGALLTDTGLSVTSVCAHIPMIDADAGARERAVAYVKGCVDLAGHFGTDVVHGLSGPLPEGVDEAQGWQWLGEAMQACAAYAAERKVRFAVEPVTGMLVAHSDHLARLKGQVSAPLYVNLDPSHLLVEGEDPVAAAHRWKDDIVHVHVKDATGSPGDFTFPPLGKGRMDFDAFFGALKDIGYTGPCSVEDEAHAFGFPFEPEQTAEQSLRLLRAGVGVKP